MNELAISFTQYMRPDGRSRQVMHLCDEETYDRASRLIDRGMSFSCEVLTTGECAFYVDKNDESVVTEICQNGPEVMEAVKRLIFRAEERIK